MSGIRALVAVGLMAVFVVPASAQPAEPPRGEVSAGYSWLPADGDDFPRPDSSGVAIGAAGHVTGWFAVIGEISWYRGTARNLGPNFPGRVAETTVRQYLVGPRFTARLTRVDLFVHGLVGQSTGDAGADFSGFSDTGFTFGGGGGADVALTPRLAARIQFDLLGSFADIVEGNSRSSVGVVWRF